MNPSQANAGETYIINQPSTQDVLLCAGTMAQGAPASAPEDQNAIQLQLQNQICSATNRGILGTPANWTNVPAH